MRSIYLAAGAAGVIGLFAACGGDDKPKVIDGGGNTGTSGKGSKPNAGDAGEGNAPGDAGAGGSPGMDADGPIVEIMSPAEARNVDGAVLVDDAVTVVCSVTESGSPRAAAIDSGSVRITLEDSTGTIVGEKSAVLTQRGEYAADFALTAAAAGKVMFACSASDKNLRTSTDTISTFVDHGPLITISTPEPSSAHPLDDLAVQFFVAPSPLAKDDDAAEVGEVKLTFDGKDFDVDEISPGKYETSLPLYNIEIFPEAPMGSVTISASNKRKPKPATALKPYSIFVDGVGPTIAITSPPPQAVVGGTVVLSFNVTDVGSGVDPDSVYVTLFSNDQPRFFDPLNGWARNGDKFTFAFDSKLVAAIEPVQTTINVKASDNVGNSSASGQSIQLYLDNMPPQVDLDPLPVRARSADSCSGSFDPVGHAVPDDLGGQLGSDVLTRFAFFRVLVNEQTNDAGQSLHYFAGTSQSDVRLYLQVEPSKAGTKLLVNKNPGVDDTCDDIGGIDSLTAPPPFTAMQPLPKTGGPPAENTAEPVSAAGCTKTLGGPPVNLCPAHDSDMFYVAYNDVLHEPFVYTVGVPDPNAASCAGIDLAFVPLGAKAVEGWVCIAARAVDKVGNVGISPPLRVCVDDPGIPGTPDCRIMSTTPPSCTDGCTPPARGGGFTFSAL